ncbi:uncharacterized protein LOC114727395 [Neltuma alba]|uniref:uncharacterized protein LOC114723696 n=1 Tax=Neltuma alba TaxID=207710 RepID=UPI0010A4BD9F|nr:uncharacterized protein LOC114723696 [Prosopis alba]XP_028769943.1 uncharacterized protein LOC114727395 [Prosopis alba]
MSLSFLWLYNQKKLTTKTQLRTKLYISSPVLLSIDQIKMAAIETNAHSSIHVRSNSFPSAPHPILSQFEEHLNRLKSSGVASSSCSISHKLGGLQDLHDFTQKLLQLSTIQQSLGRECNEKSVDQLLEGSLMLLDVCSVAKDCLQQSKESVQELQSVIRRRGTEAGCRIEGGKYLTSRKMMKKAIRKALGNLKGILKDSSNKDNETSPILSIFKEAKDVTVNTLESLLLFICDPKGQFKQSRWSTISKMMPARRIACDSEESKANEFEKVDAAFISRKHSSVENFQNHLENLEMCIQDLEIGVEGLSKQLIRTRVQLLNIFNH